MIHNAVKASWLIKFIRQLLRVYSLMMWRNHLLLSNINSNMVHIVEEYDGELKVS